MDSSYLFDMYLENVSRYKKSQAIFQPEREHRPSPLLVDLLAKERVGVVPTTGMENLLRMGGAGEEAARAASVA